VTRRDYFDDPQAPRPNSIVPAVTAVVTDDDGRVLLVHRVDNDRWALPGGVVEIGERVAETAVREVREETGIDVEVVGISGVYSDPRHVIAYDDGEVRQQFALCFLARPAGGQLRPSAESLEVRWVPRSDLAALNIHPSMRLRIEHGLDPSPIGPYIG
jgi:8-oxo-dGTP pyrophosphatase MutT (NUDIX family)